MKVLVVEDNPDHAESIKRVLVNSTDDNYSVEIAATLADALKFLKGDGFDAVLLDLSLPDGNGFDVIRRVSAACTERVAVVVLTGWGGPETEDTAKQAGADAYLLKPAEPAEVKKQLQFLVINKQIAQSRHAIEKPLASLGEIILRVGQLLDKPTEA